VTSPVAVFEPEKKRKYRNQTFFYINLHLKDGLRIHSVLRRADARGSADIICRV